MNVSPTPIRVVKVGGSLFDLPDLQRSLRAWLERQPPSHAVLIPGGGPMANLIRQVDQPLLCLDAEQIHWACIGVLTASARLLAALLPETTLIESYAVLKQHVQLPRTAIFVFAVEAFLRNEEDARSGRRLPFGWRVTSDSIAASVASAIKATELVLLKSSDLPPETTRHDAAATGLVDKFFPHASQDLDDIRWVNLRSQTDDRRLM